MSFQELASQYGYSPEEVQNFMQKQDSFTESALAAGYTPEEIQSFEKSNVSSSQPQAKTAKDYRGEPTRHVARTGARIGETVLGAPRLFGEFLEGLVPEKFITKQAKKIGLEKPVKKGFEFSKKFAPYKLFPYPEQIREAEKEVVGDYLEPRSTTEKTFDEVVETTTNLSLPFKGLKEVKMFRPFMSALGGQFAKESLKQLGASPTQQELGKLGTIIVTSIWNPNEGRKLSTDLYSLARESRPERVKVLSPALNKGINSVERQLKLGGKEPWKAKIFEKIEELKKEGEGGNFEVQALEKFKTSLGNIARDLYEEKNVSKPGIKSAQRFSQMLSKQVDNALKQYGKTNPTWEKYYRQANEVHGAIEQSFKLRNTISRFAKKMGFHSLLPLIGLGHKAGVTNVLKNVGKAALLGGGGIKTGEFAVQMSKSPTLRKHYFDLLKAAGKQDAVQMEKSLRLLDKELQSDYQ